VAPSKALWRSGLVALVLTLLSASVVAASHTARLRASFRPEHLGQPTTIFFGFRISNVPPMMSSPLTNVSVLLPEEMGLATSGLGLENCVLSTLEEIGPEGCPDNARMGSGTATAEIAVGGGTVAESAQVEVFSAPVQAGRLSLMVYANAISPVSAQLVFPATIINGPPPYGEGIDTDVPLIPSLPGAPDVAVTTLQLAIGTTGMNPDGFLYFRSVRGRRVAYTPTGLVLPPTCPRGGFRFEAQFAFQDQTTATAHATVPCPRRVRR
jgi:hypothetical protein